MPSATNKPQTPMIAPKSRSLAKGYEPAGFESETYKFWEETGCFDAADTNAPGQEAFCIVIPPPNVTGALHMGHALTNTIQDILARWHRMMGDNTLWLPGTDHAGIATQSQVEKQIAKEGKGPSGRPLTRHDLGRDKFLERTWKWKDDHGSQITNQLKRLGSSLDWKRERFTMDEGLSRAVREVFVRLYEEQLIYRGERIINWCTRCSTALSDLEVVPTERKGFLWHLVYKIVNESGDAGDPIIGPDGQPTQLVIATTRPETLLGDTAVAVHPEDERYTHLHGKKAVLPLLGKIIPVITDEYVDREFGSGALKITPAHDFNDAELGKKHNLPIVSVMGKDGKITSAGGPYAGLKFSEARERIIQDLKEQGLLVKTEDHVNKVGLCQRCDTVAEPIISKQWFVKIEPLAKPARDAVRDGRITFTPKSWDKTYFEWMDNIRDWCISRQLWWGHQIPAWYCSNCQEITVSRDTPTKCASCGAGAKDLKQDEDVLDTWFSSGLWPFSTLGWPDRTAALKTFYPTSIMETGFDIIFFWIARMIMMGLHFMDGQVPFKKIYLHAMVRDEKGEKMSKTKGNVIDPLVLIDQHGADPLRFTLAAMAGQGRDIKLSVDRVEGYRGFCNKIWNATKFLHLQINGLPASPDGMPAGDSGPATIGPCAGIKEPAQGVAKWLDEHRAELLPANRWILSRLQAVIPRVRHGLENFELNESANALYEFSWHELCDWSIEFSKLSFREGGPAATQTFYTLHHVLETLFALMHPFMPFVTEELWLSLPWKKPHNSPARAAAGQAPVLTLMFAPFPRERAELVDRESEQTIQALQSIIEAIRNFRGENGISPKQEFAIRYATSSEATGAFLKLMAGEIRSLGRITSLERAEGAAAVDEAVIPVAIASLAGAVELRIGLQGLVDFGAEADRVRKEIEKVDDDIQHIERKLGQDTFLAKAPPQLVAKEREKLAQFKAKRAELEAAIARLKR